MVSMKGKTPQKPQERSSAGNISAHCATSASWLKSAGTECISCSYGSLLDVEIETKRLFAPGGSDLFRQSECPRTY